MLQYMTIINIIIQMDKIDKIKEIINRIKNNRLTITDKNNKEVLKQVNQFTFYTGNGILEKSRKLEPIGGDLKSIIKKYKKKM